MVRQLAITGIDPARTVAVACELTEPEGRRIAQVLSLRPPARCECKGNVFVALLSVFDALPLFCDDDLDFAFEIVTRLDPECRMLPYIVCSISRILGGTPAGPTSRSRRVPVIDQRDQLLEAALELVFRRIRDNSDAMDRAPDGWDDECSARADDVDAALMVLLEYCKSST